MCPNVSYDKAILVGNGHTSAPLRWDGSPDSPAHCTIRPHPGAIPPLRHAAAGWLGFCPAAAYGRTACWESAVLWGTLISGACTGGMLIVSTGGMAVGSTGGMAPASARLGVAEVRE